MANSPLFLDSFYVFQPVFGSPARNQSTSSSSTIPTMTSSLLQSIYNQPFRPNPTTSSSITVSSPTAVEFTAAPSRNVQLIGGAVGGLALLIIVVILGAWFVKRRRNANRWKAPSSHFSSSSIKNPYWGMHQIWRGHNSRRVWWHNLIYIQNLFRTTFCTTGLIFIDVPRTTRLRLWMHPLSRPWPLGCSYLRALQSHGCSLWSIHVCSQAWISHHPIFRQPLPGTRQGIGCHRCMSWWGEAPWKLRGISTTRSAQVQPRNN